MRQRLRITYRVDGPLRYASHLERLRAWERTLRRAGLPLAYSGGFTPHPRLQSALALPVGFAADGELLDVWLEGRVEAQAVRDALGGVLPEGLSIHAVEEADPAQPPLPAQVEAAEYWATVKTELNAQEVRRRIDRLLQMTSLPRQRRGRAYDLRPLVRRLWLMQEQGNRVVLGMVLAAREGATGRPEEVLDALGIAEGLVCVVRRQLLLSPVMC